MAKHSDRVWQFFQTPAADDSGERIWSWRFREGNGAVARPFIGFPSLSECLADAEANGLHGADPVEIVNCRSSLDTQLR
jgi:hypothetical protein